MTPARQVFATLDPTGIRPTLLVAGIIVAMFLGTHLLNAVLPPARASGPAPGPISNPGQPNQTLPPIAAPTPNPFPLPTNPGTGPGPMPGPTAAPGSGQTVEIGRLVVRLEPGWTAVPSEGRVIVQFQKGNVAVDVVGLTISEGAASPVQLYGAYMQLIADGTQSFSAGQPSSLTIGGTIPAARGSYTMVFNGNQLEGDVTVVSVSQTEAIVFDAWSGPGGLRSLLPELERMIANIQVRPG